MDLAPEICMDLGRGGSRRMLRIPFTLSGRAGPRPWGSGVSGLRHPTAPRILGLSWGTSDSNGGIKATMGYDDYGL
jgi:hypothetical protein